MQEILNEVFGIWYLMGAALVFFMQAGFAMVEAGFTRAKNAGNIIMKNLMDFCLGTVAFLIVGYTFLCGTDVGGLFGWGENPLFNFTGTDWSSFVFNLVFCATAATIVSGAMAERTKFVSYCIYSIIISLIVYPIEAHWIWGGGWLAQKGFHDFAGSCAIHMVGGITALIGAKILGPRIGKFNKDGSPNGIPGHNITIGALGCFILWFGWYGFNGAAAKNGLQLATIFSTTTVAPALATCTVMLVTWIKYGKPDVAMTLNGSLAGLVAITAGCDAVNIFGAAIIGILAGLVVVFVVWLLDYKLKIDDPVGAVAVHGGCGLLGTICVGLFACGTDTMPKALGLFYGGGFDFLITQLTGIGAVALWTAVTMTIVFLIIKYTIGLRVSEEEEIVGLDKLEHGLESAYAGFAMDVSFDPRHNMLPSNELETSHDIPLNSPILNEKTSSLLSKVVIITRPEKLEVLKRAMDGIGITGMTATHVSGCGIQRGQTSYYRGAKVNMQLLPKLKIEIVVSDIPVEKVVNVAKKVLYTGHPGDGKIFVYDVENVIRISSGAQGQKALKYEEK
ncbi:MAG: ammonium transporter [Longibaculum muris]|uniref:Amt family ammonium transporter n=1 Tax=Longibaculum muris TaxID=1796628 RepID=A0A4V2W5N5_9FIRM|nr:ammonium transporter [Longibaculum muris]KXU46885.1 nitrogen regulatory protein P-II [Candidatus Stoquefichus sp. KLE1796]MED9812855.1 ammonium transporter [Longibaculum muris]TCW00519.1 Amt family ammonium transporter [Longibaculum muris]